jgi:hypothetical protein
MEKIVYIIENSNGDSIEIKENDIFRYVDANIDEISFLKKQYKLSYMKDKIFAMVLYKNDLEFTADEYIRHYLDLDAKLYGSKVFTATDTAIVKKLNF